MAIADVEQPPGVRLMRFGWLTLCGMMLLSRVAFQAAGPVRMRAFLDAWKESRTKRAWGAVALSYGAVTLVAAVRDRQRLRPVEAGLTALFLVTGIGDALLNVLPGSFSRFKEEMQRQWVRRQRDAARQGDIALFGTVNLLLGLAAAGMAAVVAGYRPIGGRLAAGAAGTAAALTAALVAGALVERRPARQPGSFVTR